MDYSISHFICSGCLQGSGFIADILTGSFVQSPKQSGYHATHCASRTGKPANGVFLDASEDFYQSGARYLAKNGFAGVESRGAINLYGVFPNPVALIEISGVSGCLTTTGKMPLADLPERRHWFGYTGIDGGPSGFCGQCSARVF